MIKMNLTYAETPDGYLIPDVTLPDEPEVTLGRFARMRLNHLKANDKLMYGHLLMRGKLTAHLAEIEQTAEARIRMMAEQTAAAMNVNETLKAENPRRWVGLMNNIRLTAEQTVIRELILA
jgi:formamidopyrimidine-DNA glycosylase